MAIKLSPKVPRCWLILSDVISGGTCWCTLIVEGATEWCNGVACYEELLGLSQLHFEGQVPKKKMNSLSGAIFSDIVHKEDQFCIETIAVWQWAEVRK